jgi:hypothetical protein
MAPFVSSSSVGYNLLISWAYNIFDLFGVRENPLAINKHFVFFNAIEIISFMSRPVIGI